MVRFRPTICVLAFGVALALSAAPAFARSKAVFKVDSVSATSDGHKIMVTAKGAVRSGGWDQPRLRVKKGNRVRDGELTIEFVATPPPPRAMVIQAILPVTAKLKVALRKVEISNIKIVAETNDLTVPVEMH